MGTELLERIEAVRRFNRFYTREIGVLQEGLLKSPFSLAEARVMFELARQEQTTATHLCQELGLDAGYISRIVRKLVKSAFVDKRPSKADARQFSLSLTKQGKKAFSRLNAATHDQIEALLKTLAESEQHRLVKAMRAIEETLGPQPESKASYLLRPHQAGDLGWIVHRHGVLYRQEYGWNEEFEALVAEIVAKFVRKYDAKLECCWVAEKDGECVGSVLLVRKSKTTAQLRLLLVEPKARGLGIGKRLVQECSRFARHAGYRTIVLWTNSVLHAARHLYEQEGYRLVAEEPHHSFGHDLIGQNWQLDL